MAFGSGSGNVWEIPEFGIQGGFIYGVASTQSLVLLLEGGTGPG